jgi:hypothetical protein
MSTEENCSNTYINYEHNNIIPNIPYENLKEILSTPIYNNNVRTF